MTIEEKINLVEEMLAMPDMAGMLDIDLSECAPINTWIEEDLDAVLILHEQRFGDN